MKLGIFGDSFASTSIGKLGAWPDLLAYHVGPGIENFALPATSLWWSYQRFLKNYQKFDKIVFCYTSHSRWPVLPEELSACAHVITPDKLDNLFTRSDAKTTVPVMKKLLEVYPLIHSEELCIFIYQHIFNSVNKLCKESGIHLVNLMPFEFDRNAATATANGDKLFIDLSEMAGSCLLGLHSVSHGEFKDDRHDKVCDVITGAGDMRNCHLHPHNNLILATIIKEKFNDKVLSVTDLYEDHRFSYHLQHLINLQGSK